MLCMDGGMWLEKNYVIKMQVLTASWLERGGQASSFHPASFSPSPCQTSFSQCIISQKRQPRFKANMFSLRTFHGTSY